MDEIGSEYRLTLLNGRRVKEDYLARALTVYNNNTPHNEKQSSNTFGYWAERYNDSFRDRLFMFSLHRNGKIIGFAELVVFVDKAFAILDYLTIEKDEHRANTFYEFFDLIRTFISDSGAVVDQILAELLISQNGMPSHSSIVWESLLRLQGFRKAHAPYYQPQMGLSKETESDGFLMVFSEDGLNSLRTETYLDFVHTLYYDHYLRWFLPELADGGMEYGKKLDVVFKKIKMAIGTSSIKVNGAAPAIVVSPSRSSKRPGIEIAVFAVPSILIIIMIAMAMAAISKFFDIGPYYVIAIFSISIVSYLSIIALAFKTAERILSKIMSGLGRLVPRLRVSDRQK